MLIGCPFDEPNCFNPNDHIHVVLPSGAVATVSPDCSNETLEALDKLAIAAKEKFENL